MKILLALPLLLVAEPALAGEHAFASVGHVCCFPRPDNFYGVHGDFNSSGGDVTAARVGLGQYTVTFEGIDGAGGGGHVQVTTAGSAVPSYETEGGHCKPVSWGAAWGDTTVLVHCYDRTGAARDDDFNVMYVSEPAPHPNLAYAWAHSPATSFYNPTPAYAVNGSGGAIEIVRQSVGRYHVRLYVHARPVGPDVGAPNGEVGRSLHVRRSRCPRRRNCSESSRRWQSGRRGRGAGYRQKCGGGLLGTAVAV